MEKNLGPAVAPSFSYLLQASGSSAVRSFHTNQSDFGGCGKWRVRDRRLGRGEMKIVGKGSGDLNGDLLPLPFLLVVSTPRLRSRAGVMATFVTMSVETSPLYGKEMETESGRINHAQATRALL